MSNNNTERRQEKKQESKGFFQKLCSCFNPQETQTVTETNPQSRSPAEMNDNYNKQPQLEVKPLDKDFNLEQDQILISQTQPTGLRAKIFQYSCPVCLRYFNSKSIEFYDQELLRVSCCHNYICLACFQEIEQTIERKCWWCKRDQFRIMDMNPNDTQKVYSDAPPFTSSMKDNEANKIPGGASSGFQFDGTVKSSNGGQSIPVQTNQMFMNTVQSMFDQLNISNEVQEENESIEEEKDYRNEDDLNDDNQMMQTYHSADQVDTIANQHDANENFEISRRNSLQEISFNSEIKGKQTPKAQKNLHNNQNKKTLTSTIESDQRIIQSLSCGPNMSNPINNNNKPGKSLFLYNPQTGQYENQSEMTDNRNNNQNKSQHIGIENEDKENQSENSNVRQIFE